MSYLIGVHAVIFDENNRMLVIRRSAVNDHNPLRWDLPGGTLEFGETLESALEREIREELSLNVEVFHPTHTYTSFDAERGITVVQILFVCRLKQEGVIALNPSEHDEARWVDKNELLKLPKIAFLEDFLQKRYDTVHSN